MENNIEKIVQCDSKTKGSLSLFRKIIIVALSILIVLIFLIQFVMIESGEEIKEVVLDWERPHITYSASEIMNLFIFMTIVVIIVLRPLVKASASIHITPNIISVELIEKKRKKKSITYLIDVSKVQKISYFYNREGNEKRLSFRGTENMVSGKKKIKENNKFDLIFTQETDELCEAIIETTGLKIKGF